MAALPLVAAGAGVVGTLAQIRQQQQAASRQNTSIAMQQNSVYASQRIRLSDIYTQRQLLLGTYQVEAQSRLASFVQQRNSLRLALLQNKASFVQQSDALQQQQNAQSDEVSYARNNAIVAADAKKTGGDAELYAALGDSAQVEAQNAASNTQAAQSVQQARQQINSALSAITSGPGRTSGIIKNVLSKDVIQAGLEQLVASQQITAQQAQQLALSRDFNNFVSSLADFELQGNMGELSRAMSEQQEQFAGGQRLLDSQYNTGARVTGLSLQALPLSANLAEQTARANYLIADNNLRSTVPLTISEGNSTIAALQAQRAQSPSLLSSLGALTSASAPLLGYFMNQRSSVPAPINYSQPPVYQQVQDIPNPVPIYG